MKRRRPMELSLEDRMALQNTVVKNAYKSLTMEILDGNGNIWEPSKVTTVFYAIDPTYLSDGSQLIRIKAVFAILQETITMAVLKMLHNA